MIRFPVPACVAVQKSVARCPIRAAISTLCGNGCDLFSASQVDLQPLIMIAVQRRPTPSAWRKCTILDCLSYWSEICLHLFHTGARERQNRNKSSWCFVNIMWALVTVFLRVRLEWALNYRINYNSLVIYQSQLLWI